VSVLKPQEWTVDFPTWLFIIIRELYGELLSRINYWWWWWWWFSCIYPFSMDIHEHIKLLLLPASKMKSFQVFLVEWPVMDVIFPCYKWLFWYSIGGWHIKLKSCGRIFKEILHNRLSLTWGLPEVLWLLLFIYKQVGLTCSLLSVPITCTSNENQWVRGSFLRDRCCDT
jgi:hypothetical protein